MKKLILSISVSTFILMGCGGSGSKHQPAVTASSSVAATSSVSTSTATSIASSAPSTSSSSVNTSSSVKTSSSSSSVLSASTSSSQVSSTASSVAFTLKSNSFASGDKIPVKYACYGTEVSPHLQWDITSDQVKSFVLIMEDFDAIPLVGYPYVHWDIYNIPANVREIAEGASLRGMPAGSIQGANDDGVSRYSGPCPPEGTGTHHYFFTLYALNKESITINSSRSFKRSEFEAQYGSSIIQQVEITGSYMYK